MRFASRVAVVLSVAASLALVASAHADPLKCQRSILKDSGKFAQARIKALQKCEDGRLKGKVLTTCAADSKTQGSIQKARDKMHAAIGKNCGGADKTCGGGDDETLASISWPGVCPDFEGMGCTYTISDCGGTPTSGSSSVRPSAMRICAWTMSIPVTTSVTVCSTWMRGFTSMK